MSSDEFISIEEIEKKSNTNSQASTSSEKPSENKPLNEEKKEVNEESHKKVHSHKETHKVKHKKPAPKHTKKNSYVPHIIGAIAIILIIALLLVNKGEESPVLAKVSLGDITRDVTQNDVDQIMRIAQAQNVNINSDEIIYQLVRLEAVLAKAEEKGITVTQEQVDTLVQSQLDQLNAVYTQEQIDEQLEAQGITYDQFVQNLEESIQNDLLVRELFAQELLVDTSVDEQILRDFYDQQQELFQTPAQAGVRHILVCYEGATRCANTRSKEEAQARAQEVLDLTAESSIQELAPEYSDGPTGPTGGDLGSIQPGVTVPAFNDAVFAANEGDIIGPVETEFGFHVIEVYSKSQAGQIAFDDVKTQLEQQYLSENAVQKQQEYIDALISEVDIEYTDE